eukprot:Sspe_Gene.52823::Locus_29248_Transcript_1_1_Confidence_1.000_Length_936::g.52823::m.52823
MAAVPSHSKSAFIFGLGYLGKELADELHRKGWMVSGCVKTPSEVQGQRVPCFVSGSGEIDRTLQSATHVVSTAPPASGGEDPILTQYGGKLKGKWVGYVSSTGVYGEGKGWVTEGHPTTPVSTTSDRRLRCEEKWRGLGATIFRIAGLYGPGRSLIDRRPSEVILHPGHAISRVHRDDAARAIALAMEQHARGVFNLADAHPAPHHEVAGHAARLLGDPPPTSLRWGRDLTAPVGSRVYGLYGVTRLVDSSRARRELGWLPRFDHYSLGLRDCLDRSPLLSCKRKK